MVLNSQIQTYQILTSDDKVCIPSILIAVPTLIFNIIKRLRTKTEKKTEIDSPKQITHCCVRIYAKSLSIIILYMYTANDYRQTTDKLIFKSVISTQRYLYF